MAGLFFAVLSLISGHNLFKKKKSKHCIGLSMSSVGRALALNTQQVAWFHSQHHWSNSQHRVNLVGWCTHSCNSSSQKVAVGAS